MRSEPPSRRLAAFTTPKNRAIAERLTHEGYIRLRQGTHGGRTVAALRERAYYIGRRLGGQLHTVTGADEFGPYVDVWWAEPAPTPDTRAAHG